MEYKLCKDNLICCDNDCRRCANLVYDTMAYENKILKKEFDKWDKERYGFINEIKRITEERNKIHDELKELIDKCQELEKKHAWLEKECEKLRGDNQRFAHECRYYIERESELVKKNDVLRTFNSDLIYRNVQLLRKPDSTNFLNSYGELNDKIESLKEDIIRLDKCLSNRQCVKEERYGE